MAQITNLNSTAGKAKVNGIEIFYESFGDISHPPVVLIMGLDAQCVIWSPTFIAPLVEAGYRIIRFDNRDIGHSTWFNNWNKAKPYTLEDMAKDTVGLLDFLSIPKAHLIGASMGGMIAQRLAISHSERVLSLTSIMSSGYALDPHLFTSFSQRNFMKLLPKLIRWAPIPLKHINMKVTVGNYLAVYKYLSGTKYEFDKTAFTELFTYAIEERKGQNPKARVQQFCAIVASGSRLNELKNISKPTLIIHGTADKLVPITHSQKLATIIPNSILVEMEGIGHEIPRPAMPEYHKHIIENFRKA
jgi:pimeloyl-ACP methyl ester carboxylesterase